MPPNKVDLNKELREKTSEPLPSKPRLAIKPNQITAIPTTHKYPFARKDEAISVDELRSRVHQGTLGVLPVRKSQEIEGLNLIMKGKPLHAASIVKETSRPAAHNKGDFYGILDGSDDEALVRNMSQSDEDEGIDDNDDAEHFHANTPATPNNFLQDKSFSNKFADPYKQKNGGDGSGGGVLNDYYFQELLKFRANTNKPAILPQSGTSGPALYSERPRPQPKPKTLNDEFKLKKTKERLLLDANLDDDERHQILMENEVKNLVDEAKKFAKLSPVFKF